MKILTTIAILASLTVGSFAATPSFRPSFRPSTPVRVSPPPVRAPTPAPRVTPPVSRPATPAVATPHPSAATTPAKAPAAAKAPTPKPPSLLAKPVPGATTNVSAASSLPSSRSTWWHRSLSEPLEFYPSSFWWPRHYYGYGHQPTPFYLWPHGAAAEQAAPDGSYSPDPKPAGEASSNQGLSWTWWLLIGFGGVGLLTLGVLGARRLAL